ncbi:MAG: HepT-like ribonuclease domain-containing protein [bacterium]
MNRNLARLNRILLYCTDIQRLLGGSAVDEFLADPDKQYTISFLIVLCGENARSLDQSIKDRHPEIDWRSMVGMRNILVHVYYEADYDLIWKTVQERIPQLRTVVETELAALSPPESMP